jgi:hypothetical protein
MKLHLRRKAAKARSQRQRRDGEEHDQEGEVKGAHSQKRK